MAQSDLATLDDSLRARRESFDRIPVVDFAPFLDRTDRDRVVRDIRWALSNAGFLYVRNHGIDPALIDDTFAAARWFFDLPAERKMALHVSRSGHALRGYTEIFGENTDPGNTRDLKECLDVGPDRPAGDRPYYGPNQWPQDAPAFRHTVSGYHDAMRLLSREILSAIALSLDLAADFFDAVMVDPISIQRLLHYPSQTGQVSRDVIGIGAHTDYGALTVLAQDDVGGLQVMNRDGYWVEAPPIPGAFVINIGDLIQRLTNDLYLANLHRVVNVSGRERYSIPFFIDADFEAVFEPLPSCISDGNPKKYRAVVCGEHKYSRYLKSFPHLATQTPEMAR